MPHLRAATPADLAFLHHAARGPAARGHLLDQNDADLIHHMRTPENDLVIWQEGDTALGFALFCGVAEGDVELCRLALAETGGGRGAAFMAALLEYGFGAHGARSVWLEVVPDNPRARALYERLGFHHDTDAHAKWTRPGGDTVALARFVMTRANWQTLTRAGDCSCAPRPLN